MAVAEPATISPVSVVAWTAGFHGQEMIPVRRMGGGICLWRMKDGI